VREVTDMPEGAGSSILDLSGTDDGKFELVPYKYDIPSLINDTMQSSLLWLESKPIEFLLSIDKDTPYYLYGDDFHVKQILGNVLFNAFMYTDRGRVELSIRAETHRKAMSAFSGSRSECILIFRVSDTGRGMTGEQVRKLFGESAGNYPDTDSATRTKGSGISITKRLVEAMGGGISVVSTPGEGSVFTVHIPQECIGTARCGSELADDLRDRRFQRMSRARNTHIDHEYMPYGRILIVDDFEANRNAAKGILLNYGLNVDTASSGFEAVDIIKSGAVFDIMFMDYIMPNMDGLEATRIIREMGYAHPIVALTAYVMEGQEELFVVSGCDEHMYKPINEQELDSLLIRLVRDKQPPDVIHTARQKMRKRKRDAEQRISHQTVIQEELKAAVVRDTNNAIAILEDVLFRMNALGVVDTELFTVTVHGIKGSLSNIDEVDLISAARKLEKAGINKRINVIMAETPSFIHALRAFVERTKPTHDGSTEDISDDDTVFLMKKMNEFKLACETFDIRTARSAMADLRRKTWPSDIKVTIDELFLNLIRGDFNKVVSEAEKTGNMTLQGFFVS